MTEHQTVAGPQSAQQDGPATEADLPHTLRRLATLKTLRELIAAEEAALRADAQHLLDTAHDTVGADRFNITLPTGEKVATVTRTQPATDAVPVVEDHFAFLSWVRDNHPGETETRVRERFTAKILNRVSQTGEAVPGIGIGFARRDRPAGMQLRYTDRGRDEIAAAWRDGRLTGMLTLDTDDHEEPR